jgi:hypothetical protein
MSKKKIPIVVLGGSDLEPAAIPQGMLAEQMLTGFKGAVPLPWGRCLAAELVARIRASKQFAEPLLVGPRRVYEDLVDAPIVDIEGNLAATLQKTVEAVGERHNPRDPVAVTTCDILPTPDDFRRLMNDAYHPQAQALFWTQLVTAPAQSMGASHWKPAYWLCPDRHQPPVALYPGHLVIVRPQALRTDFTIYLLRLAYRYRNHELRQRRLRMTMRGLARLLTEDLHQLLRFQPPTLTSSLLYSALRGYRHYRQGRATIADVEQVIATAFLHRSAAQNGPAHPVVFCLTDIVSFAKDIDTFDELAEIEAAGPFPADE